VSNKFQRERNAMMRARIRAVYGRAILGTMVVAMVVFIAWAALT
jgi:hypothetical protein